MATKKITVTVDERDLQRMRGLVADGTASSVSGFVQHAVGVALDDVAGWGEILGQALLESGGAVTDAEAEWADGVLNAPEGHDRSVA